MKQPRESLQAFYPASTCVPAFPAVFSILLPLLPQQPPQCSQLQPHWRDFPFFLSRIILLTASPTSNINTANTIIVPILKPPYMPPCLLPVMPCRHWQAAVKILRPFLSLSPGPASYMDVKCIPFPVWPEQQIQKSSRQNKCNHCKNSKLSIYNQAANLVNTQRHNVCQQTLITDCK